MCHFVNYIVRKDLAEVRVLSSTSSHDMTDPRLKIMPPFIPSTFTEND